MSHKSKHLNEIFADQFRSLFSSVEGKGISSVQNRQRIALTLFVLAELSAKSEEWEKRKDNSEETIVEPLLVTIELCERLLSVTTDELKSEKLKNKVNGVKGNLRNILKTANALELTRRNEIERVKRNIFSESDDLYRQINQPDFRYDVTQQGTGRNAKRNSKNYTKYGTLSTNRD